MNKELTSLKRFCAVMFAFCAVFSQALKAEVFNGTCGDNLSWSLNTEDSTLVITGSGEMTSNPWSNKSANIAYLSLPKGLTSIADWAFLSCSNLKAVDIPNTVSTIGSGAFSSCFSLTSIVIPESIDEIGYNVFNSCKNLSSVVIPNSVTSIGLQAFYACYALRSVELPSSIASIGIDAFGYCPTLSLVVNSWNPPTLGSNAFYPNGVSQIYVPCERLNAYMSCDGWSAYADKMLYRPMPYTVTKTPSSYGRITVVVASTVCDTTKITAIPNGGYRFVQWEDGSTDNPRYVFLTKDITVSAEFEEDKCIVGSGTCGDNLVWELSCDSVLTISGTGAMTEWANIRNVPWYEYHYTIVKSLVINEGVTSIGGYAFANCPLITSVNIPNSVTSIGSHAFNGCEGVTSIEIPNSVTSIGEYAFGECYNLSSVTLPDSITFIAEATFENCYRLENIHIPNSVTSIGSLAFYGCLSLPVIDNIRYADTYLVRAVNDSATSYIIPEGIKWIGDNAFESLVNITSIDLPSSIISMGSFAFNGTSIRSFVCRAVEPPFFDHASFPFGEYSWPETIYVPGESVRRYQESWGGNILPIPGTESCDQYGFQYDTLLVACDGETISWRRYENLPTDVPGTYNYYDSLRTIGGCDSIYKLTLVVGSSSYMVYYDTITEGTYFYPIGVITETGIYRDTLVTMFGCDSIQEWHIFALPALSGKCGDSAHWELDTISGVLVISGNGSMYDYKSASLPWRKYAQYITSAQVQEGITHLSAYAFENIRTLVSVHLPSTLETMGSMSFYCAVNVGTIVCDALTPPTGGTFKGVNRDAVIYVPCGTKSAYATSGDWGWYFQNIEDGSYEFIEDTLICYGADLSWRGHYHLPYYSDTIIYHNGNSTLYKYGGVQAVFFDSLKTVQGCDSLYVLNAYVAPYYYETIYDTINEGESHWAVRGNILSDTVFYEQYATYLGCDSVLEWHIHVTPAPRYTISVASNSSKYGSVEGAGIYKKDTTVLITAVANKGYQFNQWSDGNKDNPRQVTVTQDSTFTAIFGTKICSWEVESNDLEMGAVVTTFNEPTYAYGTQITVEASPNSGFKFVKWNDGKKYNPYRFSLLDDKYLLAIFMAEEEEQDTTTVDPSSTTATFTWPFIVGGFSYSLTIYLDFACTIPLCTITFNQYGQLIGIVFGNRVPRRTLAQDEGFTYTVSGLDANTEYFFKMETMDEENKLINTDEGSFTTSNETTGFEDIESDKIVIRKVMIDGQIYIVRGEEVFTLQGQIVK